MDVKTTTWGDLFSVVRDLEACDAETRTRILTVLRTVAANESARLSEVQGQADAYASTLRMTLSQMRSLVTQYEEAVSTADTLALADVSYGSFSILVPILEEALGDV